MEEEPENLFNIIFPNGLPGTKTKIVFTKISRVELAAFDLKIQFHVQLSI
jgi:hypothetical protein